MTALIDITGQRFGRLLALTIGERRRDATGRSRIYWNFRCDCGVEKEILAEAVRRGLVKSCGCMKPEWCGNAVRTHGHREGSTKTSEMTTYGSMRQRCYDQNHEAYPYYGGRGIKVCDRWLNGENGKTGFHCFLSDMGRKPDRRLTLERNNNDGNYEPSNCRWATMKEQALNRRLRKKAA